MAESACIQLLFLKRENCGKFKILSKKGRAKMEIFSKEDAVQQFLHDVENLMEDLYQSGFDTVHDSTLEAIKNMQKQTAAYGMQLLSDMLLQLADGLTRRRHQIKKEEDSLINLYTDVYQYMYLCKEKIECDKGAHYYMV